MKNSFLVPVVAYIEVVIRSTKLFFPDTLMSFFKRLISKNRYLFFMKALNCILTLLGHHTLAEELLLCLHFLTGDLMVSIILLMAFVK